MRQPLWQRLLRERAARAGKDEAAGALSDAGGDEADPALGPRAYDSSEILSRLRGLDGDPAEASERQQAYAEWAERVKTRRQQKVDSLRSEEENPSGPSVYWDSSTLFAESQRVDSGAAPSLLSDAELLDVLGLPPGAGGDQIQKAYRRLAKQHHPDRWVQAPTEVREEHEEQMQRIGAAYRVLRERGR